MHHPAQKEIIFDCVHSSASNKERCSYYSCLNVKIHPAQSKMHYFAFDRITLNPIVAKLNVFGQEALRSNYIEACQQLCM